jgi:hypothetical protein
LPVNRESPKGVPIYGNRGFGAFGRFPDQTGVAAGELQWRCSVVKVRCGGVAKSWCCGAAELRNSGVAKSGTALCRKAVLLCGELLVRRNGVKLGAAGTALAASGATGTSVLRCCELLVLRCRRKARRWSVLVPFLSAFSRRLRGCLDDRRQS